MTYDRAKFIIVQNTSKAYHYSLFHPEGIFRWQTNFENIRPSFMLKEETWARGCLNSMHSFLCLGFLPKIYFCVGRPKLFPIFYLSKQLFFSFKILIFSSTHKLHLLDPPVYEIDFYY